MPLSTSGNVTLNASQTKAEDLGAADFTPSLGLPLALTDGTGADQADLIFSDTRTTADEDLDLAGVLTDVYGAVITFARIKCIMIKAAAANTLDIHMGGAGANDFIGPLADATDEAVIRPGGMVMFWAPDATAWAVTAGSADQLKIAASDGATPITYDIMIIGASA